MHIKTYTVGMMGNNNYLTWDEDSKKAFMVDCTMNYQPIVDDVIKMGLDVEYIILTHSHFDHVAGTAFYRRAFPDAKLVASEKEAELLLSNKDSDSIQADIYVKDGDELSCGNMTLKFIETPGHTVGGICILVDRVLFTGDTLFQASVGRTDFPTGNAAALIDSIRNKLFVLPDDTRVLPGHVGETTIGFEKRYNPFV